MTFSSSPFFFFFNDTATTEIYTLSLHDALPICRLTRSPGLFPLHQSVAVLAPTPGRVAALGTERVPRLGQDLGRVAVSVHEPLVDRRRRLPGPDRDQGAYRPDEPAPPC